MVSLSRSLRGGGQGLPPRHGTGVTTQQHSSDRDRTDVLFYVLFSFWGGLGRTLAYDIVLNQHMPTVERLTHSNLLIQRFDGNLKQVVEIYKKMGEDVQAMVDELRQQEQQEG